MFSFWYLERSQIDIPQGGGWRYTIDTLMESIVAPRRQG